MDKKQLQNQFKVGAKVVYACEVNVHPHDTIEKGETGTVAIHDDDYLYIKLDKDHPDLLDWENQHIYEYKSDEIDTIIGQIEWLNPQLFELNKKVDEYSALCTRFTKRGADDTHSREVFWGIIWDLKTDKQIITTIPNTADGWNLYSHNNKSQKLTNKLVVHLLHNKTYEIVRLIKRFDNEVLNVFYAQYEKDNS